MNQPRMRLLIPFTLLIAVLAVSTASILIRFAQREAASLVIAALRLAFATIVLAPHALLHHRTELQRLTRRAAWLALLAGFFLSIHFATWISSLEYTTVASSVVLVSTGPLWVALLSPLTLREPLRRAVFLGLVLAFSGGLVISLAGACFWEDGLLCPSLSQVLHGRALFGNLLALVGAWAVAGYLIIGRKLRPHVSLVPYIFVVYAAAALFLSVYMLLAGYSPLGYQPLTYVWILLLALIPQLIGHSAYNWALAHLPAAFVAVTTLGEPIGSAILAYFLLQESPTPAVMAGGALILGGIYLALRQA